MRKLLLIILSVLIYATSFAQIITTVAGGLGDGRAAISVSLNSPSGAALDGSGNIYIADRDNHRIRKVTTSTGIISTIAGNGTAAYRGDGSAATSANLNNPNGLAVDDSGNIFIADTYNHCIRKVSASTGIISTVAGNGKGGYGGDDSAATSANLAYPCGVTVDNFGNIYIADKNNNRIRKVAASTGIISTVAGGGTYGDGFAATFAVLISPYGITVDDAGNIYITEYENHRIRKVTASSGIISTIAGNGTAGYNGDSISATSAKLYSPSGIAVDSSGNIYIADIGNQRIRKVTDSTGIISTVAGNGTAAYGGDSGLATSASLYIPNGLTLDGSGNIFIADLYNHRIRKVTASTGIISTVAGNERKVYGGDGSAATLAILNYPERVAVDGSGNIYIVDAGNKRIRKVAASNGIISTVAGNGIQGYGGDGSLATSAKLNRPTGVTVDDLGKIYIADNGNSRIRKVTVSTGIISTAAGNGGLFGYGGDGLPATAASLGSPDGVAVDDSGNIYIAVPHRIVKVTASTGIMSTVAGTGEAAYGGDGSAATLANLSSPRGVAVDGSGNIYIADYYNNRIRKVTASTGIISTVAGNGAAGYGGDGNSATSASINYPYDVAIDASGNIYIADYANHRIRKVSASTGIISTVAGNEIEGYGGDGSVAASANLKYPSGVAVDGSGNIYIADVGNHIVRKVTYLITNNIIAGSQTICAGSAPDSLIGSTPIGGTGNYTYSWLSSTTSATIGFAAISSSNTINYSPGILTQNTWFKRKVVLGDYTDTSAALLVSINPKPLTSNILGNVNVAILDTASYSVNGLRGSVFNWSVSGATIQSGAGSNQIQVKWSTSGAQILKVTETSNNGCIGTEKSLSLNVSPNIGINELKVRNQVIIHPNPFSETINITLLNNLKLERATIYDLLGNEVINSNKNKIETNSLKSGVYLIMVIDNNGNSYSQKLIKN